MVKLPSLNDLKRMGADFVDAAKSVKSGVTPVAPKQDTDVVQGDEVLKNAFQAVQATLQELNETQLKQVGLTKQLEQQLTALNQLIENKKPEVK